MARKAEWALLMARRMSCLWEGCGVRGVESGGRRRCERVAYVLLLHTTSTSSNYLFWEGLNQQL